MALGCVPVGVRSCQNFDQDSKLLVPAMGLSRDWQCMGRASAIPCSGQCTGASIRELNQEAAGQVATNYSSRRSRF